MVRKDRVTCVPHAPRPSPLAPRPSPATRSLVYFSLSLSFPHMLFAVQAPRDALGSSRNSVVGSSGANTGRSYQSNDGSQSYRSSSGGGGNTARSLLDSARSHTSSVGIDRIADGLFKHNKRRDTGYALELGNYTSACWQCTADINTVSCLLGLVVAVISSIFT